MVTPEEFFSAYSPNVRELCLQLRSRVKQVLPEAEETVFEAYKNVSYGTGESRTDKDLICYIAPFGASANLGFYRGALLPDLHGLLRGTGKLLRHVKFFEREEVGDTGVLELLRAAKAERLGS